LIFSSELKGILAHPLYKKAVGTEGLSELFTFSETPGHGIWAGVKEVPPGSVVSFDSRGLRQQSYWTIPFKEHRDTPQETVQSIKTMLNRIVSEQLVADVPHGLLLSGGLDSSYLAGIATTRSDRDKKLRTFSVSIGESLKSFSSSTLHSDPDGPYAVEVAEHLGSNHTAVVQNPHELTSHQLRQAVVRAYDLPIGYGDIDISLIKFLHQVSADCTVALSGEGADELFGGYSWFHRMPEKTDGFPWLSSPRSRWAATRRLYARDFLAAIDGYTYLKDRHSVAAAEVRALAPSTGNMREDHLRQTSYLHLTRFMPGLLRRKDRLSMANGIEVRVPYCDHTLVEYVFNVPWSIKNLGYLEKGLLRAAAKDSIPPSVTYRPKSHYPSSEQATYTDALRRQVRNLIASPSHSIWDIFDHSAVRDTLREPYAGPQHIAIERLLDTAVWLEMYRPSLGDASS
jgi:asparagine synthase (glutamine-hydrolysing)